MIQFLTGQYFKQAPCLEYTRHGAVSISWSRRDHPRTCERPAPPPALQDPSTPERAQPFAPSTINIPIKGMSSETNVVRGAENKPLIRNKEAAGPDFEKLWILGKGLISRHLRRQRCRTREAKDPSFGAKVCVFGCRMVKGVFIGLFKWTSLTASVKRRKKERPYILPGR